MLPANKTSVQLYTRVVILVSGIIAFLAYCWGWKTSGVLENTMRWNTYPEGYKFILHHPWFGDWPINKESQYYINGALGFLNEPGFTLNIGSGYEIYRTLYSFLLRTFWFVHPMIAVLLLDVMVWLTAVLSIFYSASRISNDRIFIIFSTLFALFGQGFLQSVGEGMGHVLGYASGYFILALTIYLEPWKETSTWRTELPIYAFIGIWQFAYGTALFHLPIPLLATLYRLRHQTYVTMARQILPLFFVATVPYVFAGLLCGLFIQGGTGVLSLVLDRIHELHMDWYHIFGWYLFVLSDSFVSLGPLAFFGLCGIMFKIYQRDKLFLTFFAILLMQFLLMAFLLLPLAGRGYATFNFSPLLCLGGGAFCSLFYERIRGLFFKKAMLACAALIIILYPSAVKLGYRLPNQIFMLGLNEINMPWQTYEQRAFS